MPPFFFLHSNNNHFCNLKDALALSHVYRQNIFIKATQNKKLNSFSMITVQELRDPNKN